VKARELRQRDIRVLWHPYTEITSFEASEFPIIERARGCSLFDVEGRELLDGISSWWCVNLGHSHPRLVRAIQEQAEKLQHTLLGGMSHPAAIALAERLARIAPGGLGHVLFASDGTSAVEAALKIALQRWTNLGESGRTSFIALEEGYHGDSLGAVGVGYVEAFHRPFAGAIRPAFRALSPHCNRCPMALSPERCSVECFDSMEKLIRDHHAECAAVIVEPLCQAAGGMRIYPEAYLRRLRAACSERGLLLIADEIAVGMGRTGSRFACERAGIAPDLMTLGKGLTGGLLPMSATLVTDAVYDGFRADGERARTFFHGHTFCGNPITSALALAALDVYEEEQVLERLGPRIRQLDEGMRRIAEGLGGSPMRSLGMIAAIELLEKAGGAARAKKVARRAVELGLLIRPLGNTLYLWPPLTCTEGELGRMLELLACAARETPAGP
jgi:adenosylmethionine-8-amino-7-oxononanoate aminotransferase